MTLSDKIKRQVSEALLGKDLKRVSSLMKKDLKNGGDPKYWFDALSGEVADTIITLSLLLTVWFESRKNTSQDKSLQLSVEMREVIAQLVAYLPIHKEIQKGNPFAIIDFVNWGSQVRKKWKATPVRAITGVTPEAAQQFNMSLETILKNMGNELVKVLDDWKQRQNPQRTIWMMGEVTTYLEEIPEYLEVLNMMAKSDRRVTLALEKLLKKK
ncbi:hypothetical protein [Shimazuella alba]|uniref:Uncharacterized protein n=1 Tax=Shimazuella alba TaxID=2690964 RepID=A0A6I4W083_9BACL|nr:hypothetical protein [Shimazuella alba]MXQ55640.1 hypothetical protein [Shimazuella alba]